MNNWIFFVSIAPPQFLGPYMPTVNMLNENIVPLSAMMGGTQTFATLPQLFDSLGMSKSPSVVQVEDFLNVC